MKIATLLFGSIILVLGLTFLIIWLCGGFEPDA
jgi:hypothetical protein